MSTGHSTDRDSYDLSLTAGRISELPVALILVMVLIVTPFIACTVGGLSGPVPLVTITSPASGATFTVGQEIVVQASATDPSGIVRLELWANGVLVGGMTDQSPQGTLSAAIRWVPGAPGQYTLEVRAINVEQRPTASASVIVIVEQGPGPLPTPTATLVIQPTNTLVIQPTLPPGQPTPTPCSPSITSNTELNVRAGPGTNYQAIGTMRKGDVAQVTGRNADSTWWQIVFSGAQGWVSVGYTTPNCVENVPVVGPPAPPPTPTPSAAINFRADRTTLNAGECTTVRWDVDNVQAVFYNDGSGDQGVGGHDARTVCPTVTTIYYLKVVRLDGSTVVQQLTIIVAGIPGPVVNFRADSTSIQAGECTMLRWDVDNATAVYLNDGQGEAGVPGHSSAQVCPGSTTTYVLRVTRLDNTDEWYQVTIQVKGVERHIGFRADRTTLSPGQCTTLRWDVDGARKIYLDLGGGEKRVDNYGGVQVCPSQTTTYNLRVEWPDGSEEGRQVTIHIQQPTPPHPEIITFSFDKSKIKPGECATLTWKVKNASAVYLQRLIPGGQWEPVAATGSRQECPPQTTTYRLKVEGYDKSVIENEVILEVQAPPPPATPTHTPVPPTHTRTPTPTHIHVLSTHTPIPTHTRVPPTHTPIPTHTRVPPIPTHTPHH
jgi:uncharacterized cupredoxin-like copper-binding protein